MDEVSTVDYYRKWKVPALQDFFRKVSRLKWGLKVTGNKELLVITVTAHNMHIVAMFVIVLGFD